MRRTDFYFVALLTFGGLGWQVAAGLCGVAFLAAAVEALTERWAK